VADLVEPAEQPPRPVPKLTARSLLFGGSQVADASELAVGSVGTKIYSSQRELSPGLSPAPEGRAVAGSGTSVPEKSNRNGPAGLGAFPSGPGEEESPAGNPHLERPGLAIIADYPLDAGTHAQKDPPAVALPPASNDLFAIDGALARRRILKMSLPRYPRWAEEKGIEAQISVRLAATVRGDVEPDLYILRTSGYPELDRLVLDAVKSIVFAPEPDSDAGRQDIGVVTFNFKLRKDSRGWP
jgi:TonB family protein